MINLFRRRYLISLTYLLVVVIGVLAWRDISLEESPEINLPSVTVSYSWGSTSPEVMEKEITRKVEQAASRLRDVEQIISDTGEGSSQVTIRFSDHAPVEFRTVELQEYLMGLQESLPPNLGPPRISQRVPEELQDIETILIYTVSGERQVNELLQYVRQNIRLPLLGLDGVSEVSISGATDPALVLEFHTGRIEQFDLNPASILGMIRDNLDWRSSGFIGASGMRYSMLVPPQFDGISDIRNMPVAIPHTERKIRLSDIAEISIQDTPQESIMRVNGSPSLSIRFEKESGADAIKLADEIRSRMEAIHAVFPEDMDLRLARDDTEELREQFGNLQYQAMISLLMVFLVLLAFIRRFRAPFVILGSIIFSLMMSVGVLYFIGYTLNVLTLAGLTVALGMIIDNAVVVFEQVNPGLPVDRERRLEHIREQLPRTLVPVFGSTFTTVGIFIPLFFALEELQLFLVPLAVALSLTLISSVFIALTWIPYSLIWLVPVGEGAAGSGPGNGKAFVRLRRGLLRLFTFRRRIRWVLYIALIATIGIPVWAIETPAWDDEEAETWWPEFTRSYFDNRNDIDPWIGGLPYRFFNETYFGSPWGGRQQGQRVYINIRTPQGTPLEEIDKMALSYERIAQPYEEAFSYYETRISQNNGTAYLVFEIKDEYLRRPEPYIFYAEANFLAARIGNSGISVGGLGDGTYTSLGSSSVSRSITLTGYSYDGLLELAQDLERRLRRSRRVNEVDIHGTGSYGSQDFYRYLLKVDRHALALRGIDLGQLYSAIALDIDPANPGGGRMVELNGTRFNLIGRNRVRQNRPEELLGDKRITGGDSLMFSLDEVAQVTREKTQSSIRRTDQSYSRTVGVDFLGPYRLAQTYIEGVIEETPVPVGTNIRFGGGFFAFGQDENTRNLLFLLALTVLSVWMIVSALLESWTDPLFVIMAVPLSLIGVMAGSLYHDISFDNGAIAGTLLCVGVVVNNSILLMHEKQLFRSRGIHGIRSWLCVYRNKMRAVLVTTITTIGGLIPMIVLGESEFWQTLATVVVWGLSGSTILLLLLMGIWEPNRLSRAPEAPIQPEDLH